MLNNLPDEVKEDVITNSVDSNDHYEIDTNKLLGIYAKHVPNHYLKLVEIGFSTTKTLKIKK